MLKDAKKLPENVLRRIRKKLELLKQDPLKHSEPLVNLPYRKVRVGDYRIIIDLRPQEKRYHSPHDQAQKENI
ncbi:MAG: type II toxin-antitoxin system RelE/ParE family toxin [Candidatus Diapherotrites archaeon]|nr:type II toxin-antitoxin system RelE/ParE family toxin [Candidatus Diapherotrites archaeon]